MDTRDMSHPTDITCPACNAAPGAWCTVNGLRRAKGLHPSRVKAYRVQTRWESSNPRCPDCNEYHKMDGQGRIDTRCPLNSDDTEPNWSYECEVCGATPVVPATGMCGPCTFGEAETTGGNW